ncbi:MAG: beta-galactosidase [Acidobacteriota bacterium]|nr:beta-galactosidase [Acidobacteriota bacterium]
MLNSSLLFRLSLAALFALVAIGIKPGIRIAGGQAQNSPSHAALKQPVQVVNGYPQFQINGQPFFAHSAAFFYNRLPRDEWAASLTQLKEMGINTVDLYITWNWHEPEEGKLDFDGHSNPRRDVKGLIEMVAEMGFAVIVRPGPVILNEWRNGGYPDWLLARPEYQMNETARLDGHYPPLAGVSSSNSEEASKQWMANETHMRYTRKWFADVMREVLKDRQAAPGNTRGGNIIAIQLDDDQAINRANYNGPIFWQYMNSLAAVLREAGAMVPVYINPTDMRVSAAGAPHNIGAMGQWYFNFGTDATLRWEDAATLQFYTETLKTQPHFPPMLIEYQAGWYGTGDDSYAKTADPTNTLLSSRVAIGHGLRGLNYFPVQDTLYPAGYEVPWANHYYTWESALNLEREERPRAAAVHRNGRLITGLGSELAAAHKAADLGLVYPVSSFDQPNLTREDVLRISRAQLQIQQFCQLNQISVEYLDLEFQPLELLKRHKAILLPTFDDEALKKTEAKGREEITAASEERRGDGATGRQGERKLALSNEAQRKLVEFVKGGGLLVCTPALPQGTALNELKAEPLASRVIVVPDFWRAVPIEPGKSKREEVIASVQNSAVEFVSRLSRLGVNRGIKARVSKGSERAAAPSGAASAGASIEPDFIATRLVTDENNRGYGFISLANFDDKRAMRVSLNVADPASANSRLELPELSLRARDALMLPLRLPINNGQGEEVTYATAELVKHEMANGKIRLRFYAPDVADVALKLRHNPQGAVTIDGVPTTWAADESGLVRLKLTKPKTTAKSKDADELAGRRQHELDVEIIYETGLSELNVKTTKLIIGDNNQVAVEVSNRTAIAVRGKLLLAAARGFQSNQLSQDVDLAPQSIRTFNFALPVSAKAVTGDQMTLRATLGSSGRQYFSPSVAAEIAPRFSWQVTPKTAWPLRADTRQRIGPPLFLPSDASATTAQFSIRTGNNTAQPITLSRESLLVNGLPLKLAPEEEIQSAFSYNFAPGEKSALNPFNVTLSDGKLTEIARVNFIALRKGEAVAFAYDVDRDGFDDYVMENEFLRLIVSPRAGARSFALINKRTGANVFTPVGGLRDKFVELDPADPTRNPRRKRGMYGTFNRPYSAEIIAGMGRQAVLKLDYDAPEVYPAGVRIERTITLKANEEFLTVDYRVTPKVADGKQAFWSATSIAVGDPLNKARRFIGTDGAFEFAAMKTRALNATAGWIAAPIDNQNTFGVMWRAAEVGTAEIEMKDFSSFVNIKFKPFASANAHTYHLAFYFGALPPERLAAERGRMMAETK